MERLRCRAFWLPLNAEFTGVMHSSKAIALCLAVSWALVECCCARSPAQSRSHVAGVASALPIPQVAEQGYIAGTHWNPDEGAPGFEVLTEYPPLVTDAAGTSGSGYLGRVSDAFYFRNDAGELSFAQATGGPRTVVARGVPKAVLLTGDASSVYWVTPECEVFAPPARQLASCRGRAEFCATDREFIYVIATTLDAGSPLVTRLWRISRSGGVAEAIAELDAYSSFEGVVFDGESFYYRSYAGSGALFRVSRRGGKPVPFARENPQSRIEALQFADEASVFWTSTENGTQNDSSLVRADKAGGAPRILGNAGGVVATDAQNFYWFDSTFYGLFVAPRGGGVWQHRANLPNAGFEIFLSPGGVIAMDGSTALWLPKDAPRPRKIHVHEGSESFQYLTLSGTDLYFVNWAFNAQTNLHETQLWSMPQAGGAPHRIASASFWSAPVIDGAFAYYRSNAGTLVRTPLDGGKASTLVSAASLAGFPRNVAARGVDGHDEAAALVAVDATDVFFADPERGLVLRARKSGGSPSVIARISDTPRALALDEAYVYVGTASFDASGDAPRLLRVSKSGKEVPTVLAKDESDTPTQIAVTATHVLWTDARALYRIAKRGGNVETLRDSACDFTIRGDVVFFSNCVSPGNVWRLGLSDGKLSALATNLMSPRYPVTDGRGVYWITTGMYMHPFSDVLGCCAIWSFDL